MEKKNDYIAKLEKKNQAIVDKSKKEVDALLAKMDKPMVVLHDSIGGKTPSAYKWGDAWSNDDDDTLIALRLGNHKQSQGRIAHWYLCASILARSPFACEKRAKWIESHKGVIIHHASDIRKNMLASKKTSKANKALWELVPVVQRVSSMPLKVVEQVDKYMLATRKEMRDINNAIAQEQAKETKRASKKRNKK
jgi:hypothetical protein